MQIKGAGFGGQKKKKSVLDSSSVVKAFPGATVARKKATVPAASYNPMNTDFLKRYTKKK